MTLGLIGGLGVGAAVHYYQELVKAGATHLLVIHADMNFALQCVKEHDTARLAQYFAKLIQQLANGGADIAVIPAITPHICAPELIPISPLPIVNLIEEVAKEIERRGLKRVALFGTRFTVESKMFGQLQGVEVVTPQPDETDLIHKTYFEIVGEGRGGDEQYQIFRSLAHKLIEREGVEAIILAGTELSLLFNETNTDFPHIDCARLHIQAIMHRLVS